MKKLLFILMLMMGVLFTACDDDENENGAVIIEKTLNITVEWEIHPLIKKSFYSDLNLALLAETGEIVAQEIIEVGTEGAIKLTGKVNTDKKYRFISYEDENENSIPDVGERTYPVEVTEADIIEALRGNGDLTIKIDLDKGYKIPSEGQERMTFTVNFTWENKEGKQNVLLALVDETSDEGIVYQMINTDYTLVEMTATIDVNNNYKFILYGSNDETYIVSRANEIRNGGTVNLTIDLSQAIYPK